MIKKWRDEDETIVEGLHERIISDELFNKGKKVFLEAGNCAACHTLSDAESIGDIGPNLNQIRPNVERILMAVRNGIGVMPAMEGLLSNEEIEAVAHYVSISADQ